MPLARCGLTFLPITEPSISKRCEICDREFLDEVLITKIFEKEDVGWDQYAVAILENEPPAAADDTTRIRLPNQSSQANGPGPRQQSTSLGLMEALSASFDVCPYCQGKYIG